MESKILKQVEFYFSDSNLPKDKFLLEETKKNEGWVALSTLMSFSRMKQLTEDLEVVKGALASLLTCHSVRSFTNLKIDFR